MWRSFFMACAVTLLILGAECLVVKKAVLASQLPAPPSAPSTSFDYLDSMTSPAKAEPIHRVIEPPEWAPWSLLSAGAVVMLYAMSMPRAAG